MPARLPERRPGEVRHRAPLPGVEGGIVLARRADRPVDAPLGFLDVDQGDPLQRPGRGPHGHHLGTLVSLPFLVAALELDRDPARVTLERPQRISARALHGRLSLLIRENRDARLEQRVVGDGLSLFVVVVLHESVVTQQNRCESFQIIRNLVLRDLQGTRPRLCLPVVRGIGEKLFEPVDVTDRRLFRTPVQTGCVPLLQAAVHGPRPDLGIPAKTAVLVEERGQRGHARGDRLHHRQRRLAVAAGQRENENQEAGNPFPGPLHKCAMCHHRSPRRFPHSASCY
ncbi:hypothetical protein QFZ76_001770 [Streptomyces sp. V4I2]|nr:hypothetical protein [Streptomyces sp. V4I2]